MSNEADFDLTEFTLMAMIRFSDLPLSPAPFTPGRRIIISKGSEFGNYSFELLRWGGASYGNLGFSFQVAAGNYTSSEFSCNLFLGTWYHVAVTYFAGGVEFFVNGEPCDLFDGAPAPVLNDEPVLIGAAPDLPADERFSGKIDEVRIYSQALEQTTLDALSPL